MAPYRNRPDQFTAFQAHVSTYFARDNAGFLPDMTPTSIASANLALLQQRRIPGGVVRDDGIADVSFEILERRDLAYAHRECPAHWEMASVRLTMTPGQAQLDAVSG